MAKLGTLVILALLIAGCAAGSQASGAPSSGGEPTLGNGLPSGKPGQMPPMRDPIEIVGLVEVGVEPGCTMLRTANELYQLTGSADPLIQPGARLVVLGQPRPDLMTTCQQGTPFQVSQVRAE